MEEKVLEILKNLFELETADMTLSQETCEKWDSMGQLNMVVELEAEFDLSFEPEEIAEMTSVKKIVDMIREKQS